MPMAEVPYHTFEVSRTKKISLRYPYPKSLPSGRDVIRHYRDWK